MKAIDDLAAGVLPPDQVKAQDMPDIISKVDIKDGANWRDRKY